MSLRKEADDYRKLSESKKINCAIPVKMIFCEDCGRYWNLLYEDLWGTLEANSLLQSLWKYLLDLDGEGEVLA